MVARKLMSLPSGTHPRVQPGRVLLGPDPRWLRGLKTVSSFLARTHAGFQLGQGCRDPLPTSYCLQASAHARSLGSPSNHTPAPRLSGSPRGVSWGWTVIVSCLCPQKTVNLTVLTSCLWLLRSLSNSVEWTSVHHPLAHLCRSIRVVLTPFSL